MADHWTGALGYLGHLVHVVVGCGAQSVVWPVVVGHSTVLIPDARFDRHGHSGVFVAVLTAAVAYVKGQQNF